MARVEIKGGCDVATTTGCSHDMITNEFGMIVACVTESITLQRNQSINLATGVVTEGSQSSILDSLATFELDGLKRNNLTFLGRAFRVAIKAQDPARNWTVSEGIMARRSSR